ncbi:hypothetical protein C173_23222 [Paenibacillus sp. FSL R7-277]|uniref:hypothetical protein n=1 Tax=Paenibacillus sp. FSL R7-277 TaxID=1227352 RepID=UPI0003E22EBD|nr:hypothetical protein [Paenibacillus sp. FSL R7-277]ETT63258.1 hypothetical protein C173_23222 [Paenibacillus sp. FSL R7-277]
MIAGVVILNVIVLSPGLLGIEIGGSPLETASAVTLLIISLLVVLYGSYTLLFKPPAAKPVSVQLETREDYIAGLGRHRNVKVLKDDISLALDQMERIEKKKTALLQVLGRRFDPAELSFRKFHSVIMEVEKLFYLNIRGLLNKLSVFDAAEFAKFSADNASSRFSSSLIQKKTALYNEYLSYVKGCLGANEEILLKLDQLLLEITELGSADYSNVEEMPCMQELTALIGQTKLYQ